MMKKLLLSVALAAFVAGVQAQTTRVQLYEVFSGENCGPCASSNPTTHALMVANPTSIIALKYQVPIPSAGPIYYENTTDPTARRTYYGVTSAPNARHDGATIGNGHSLNLDQSLVTARQSVSSPFSLTVEHSFNSSWDSIFISVMVTAAQAVSSGSWVAQIALIEKNMLYASPPGSNGETEFHNVTRKMYPSAAGTVLPSVWTNGQSQTITIAAPVPAYIRDIAEVGIVAFVQDNVSKEVAQAAKSEPLAVPLYSTVTPPAVSFYNCTEQLTPVLNVSNIGSQAITTMTINQKVNGVTQTVNWTGSLAAGANANCTLNPMTLNAGNNEVEYTVVSMNGQPHPSQLRGSAKTKLFLQTTKQNTLNQSFLTTAFPPAGWAVDHGSTPTGWTNASAGANGSIRSAKMDFYNIPAGAMDYLYLPRMDLTGASGTSSLTFYLAHAQYQTSSDRLKLQLSTDCGQNWNDLFSKSGAALATAPSQTAAYTPGAGQWRMETVDLTGYNGNSDLLLRFEATSNYGNNLYLDEVSLSATVGLSELAEYFGLQVYPNPVTDFAKLNLSLPSADQVQLSLKNMLGQTVKILPASQLEAGQHQLEIGFEGLYAGMYLLEIRVGSEKMVKRIIKD